MAGEEGGRGIEGDRGRGKERERGRESGNITCHVSMFKCPG